MGEGEGLHNCVKCQAHMPHGAARLSATAIPPKMQKGLRINSGCR